MKGFLKMKRKLSLLLALVLMLSTLFSVNVLSASKTEVNWQGVKTYATKEIKVYKNTKTSSSSGKIYDGDCIIINSYDKSSKKFNVKYLVTTGKNKGATATGYIKASDIGYSLSNKAKKTWNIASGFEIKGYTLSSKFNKALTFAQGTTIYEFGSKNDYISVFGKVSGTYWLVYIKKSDVRKVPSISTSKTYRIASKLNKNYVLDVSGGSKDNGANIQLYKWNKTSAQVFKFSNAKNGAYHIANYNSKKYIICDYNNVCQWNINDSWYIAEDNDGYLIIVTTSGTGFCIDVNGGKVSNGTNIQVYKQNNTASQRFKLIEVNKFKTA